MGSVCTIMVGRLDDWLKAVGRGATLTVDPGYLEWAGVAVFKKAYRSSRNEATESDSCPLHFVTICTGASLSVATSSFRRRGHGRCATMPRISRWFRVSGSPWMGSCRRVAEEIPRFPAGLERRRAPAGRIRHLWTDGTDTGQFTPLARTWRVGPRLHASQPGREVACARIGAERAEWWLPPWTHFELRPVPTPYRSRWRPPFASRSVPAGTPLCQTEALGPGPVRRIDR